MVAHSSGGRKAKIKVLAGPPGHSELCLPKAPGKSPSFALPASVSSLVSVRRSRVTGFTAHPDNFGGSHLEILNYLCKDPFFQKGKTAFTGAGS